MTTQPISSPSKIGYPAIYAFDKNNPTAWKSLGDGTNVSDLYIGVQFDAQQQVASIKVTQLDTDTVNNIVPVDKFIVETSNDGTTWNKVVDETPVVAPNTTPPDAPKNVKVEPKDKELIIRWDWNTESDFNRYNVYVNNTLYVQTATPYADIKSLTNNTQYTIDIISEDVSGNKSSKTTVVAAPNTLTTVLSSSAKPVDGQVQLKWNKPTGAISYNVYVDGVKANTSPITATSYNTAITNRISHIVEIAAVNSAGAEGPRYSYTVIASEMSKQANPATPTNFKAIVGDQKLLLTWDAVPNAWAYRVEYDDGIGFFVDAVARPTINEYLLEQAWSAPLVNDNPYKLKLYAVGAMYYDASGNLQYYESPATSIVTATPKAIAYLTETSVAPSIPTGLAVKEDNDVIYLSWNANPESRLKGYNVYQNGVKVTSTPIKDLGFMAKGLSNGTTYSFEITSVDIDNKESNHTTAVTGTPNMPSISYSLSYFTDGSVDPLHIDTTHWVDQHDPSSRVNYTIDTRFWEGRQQLLRSEYTYQHNSLFDIALLPSIQSFHRYLWKMIRDIKENVWSFPYVTFDAFKAYVDNQMPSLTIYQVATIYVSAKFKMPVLFYSGSEDYFKQGVLDAFINESLKLSQRENCHWIDVCNSVGMETGEQMQSGYAEWILLTNYGVVAQFNTENPYRPQSYSDDMGPDFTDTMGWAKYNIPIPVFDKPSQPLKSLDDLYTLLGNGYNYMFSNYQEYLTYIQLNAVGQGDVLIHELGHALDAFVSTYWGSTFPGQERLASHKIWWDAAGWSDFYNRYATKSHFGPLDDGGYEAPLTTYAHSNAWEDFAETFRYYVVNPTFLQEQFPKRFAVMEQWIKPMIQSDLIIESLESPSAIFTAMAIIDRSILLPTGTKATQYRIKPAVAPSITDPTKWNFTVNEINFLNNVGTNLSGIPAPALVNGLSFSDPTGKMNDGKTVIHLESPSVTGNIFRYKISADTNPVPTPSIGDDASLWTSVSNNDILTVLNGMYIGVAEVDATNRVVQFSNSLSVSTVEPVISNDPNNCIRVKLDNISVIFNK